MRETNSASGILGLLDPERHTGIDGIGGEIYDGTLLTSHAETALITNSGGLAGTNGATGTVSEDEVAHPAGLLEFQITHVLQAGHGIHDRITPFLIGDYQVYHFITFPRIQGKMLRAFERSMEIQRNLMEIRTSIASATPSALRTLMAILALKAG